MVALAFERQNMREVDVEIGFIYKDFKIEADVSSVFYLDGGLYIRLETVNASYILNVYDIQLKHLKLISNNTLTTFYNFRDIITELEKLVGNIQEPPITKTFITIRKIKDGTESIAFELDLLETISNLNKTDYSTCQSNIAKPKPPLKLGTISTREYLTNDENYRQRFGYASVGGSG